MAVLIAAWVTSLLRLSKSMFRNFYFLRTCFFFLNFDKYMLFVHFYSIWWITSTQLHSVSQLLGRQSFHLESLSLFFLSFYLFIYLFLGAHLLRAGSEMEVEFKHRQDVGYECLNGDSTHCVTMSLFVVLRIPSRSVWFKSWMLQTPDPVSDNNKEAK